MAYEDAVLHERVAVRVNADIKKACTIFVASLTLHRSLPGFLASRPLLIGQSVNKR